MPDAVIHSMTPVGPYPPGTGTGHPVVLIPAYVPEPVLPGLVKELMASGLVAAVAVVDDGSGILCEPIFREAAQIEGVHLLRHVVNLGKGAALKTGLNYVACQFPNSTGIVTADADGQHTARDILATVQCAIENPRALVLGSRQLDGKVPFRSKFGNLLTRNIMRAVVGQKLMDTQTGLRGIPMGFVGELLRSPANGYDFELDMLVRSKYLNLPIREVPIETVYVRDNRTSHFNPLVDSMRIYFVLLRFSAVSVLTALLDNVVFALLFSFSSKILLCQTVARLLAGLFNYSMNKRNVFHHHVRGQAALAKYWLTVAVTGSISYLLIQSLARMGGVNIMAAKLLAEFVLFFFTFIVQRDFVFSQKALREDR